MSKQTGIKWTDHTLNGWWGCVEVSPGCDNCYARELSKRFGRDVWGVHAPRYFTKAGFKQCLAWNRDAERDGVRRRVFVQSMSDLFEVLPDSHPQRRLMAQERMALFEHYIPSCPNLDFQLLTKRVGNVKECVPTSWLKNEWPFNAWMGISTVNQAEANRDIPKLLQLPAPVRFLSVEPMLESISLEPVYENVGGIPSGLIGPDVYVGAIHWVIVGGESGPKARPFNPLWADSLRFECQSHDIAFFMKQMGQAPIDCVTDNAHGTEWQGWDVLRVQEFPAVLR